MSYFNGSAVIPGLILNNSGNLGIGTTNPNARLEVSGSGNPGILLTSSAYPTTFKTQLGLNGGTQ